MPSTYRTENAPLLRGAFFFGLLALFLYALFSVYEPGFSHEVKLDDEANLHGLRDIRDFDTAVAFVFGGNAGPTGRPLALASFLVDRHSWPDRFELILRNNALIHLCNVVLVAWLALRLVPFLPWPVAHRHAFALAVAALWGSAPLLVSTSLMAVQRMTSLSASCSLLAAVGYVAARHQFGTRPRRAMTGMTLAVGLGTALAVLAKEIALLLPLLLWLTEQRLLRHAPHAAPTGQWRRRFAAWKLVFFGVPLIALVTLVVRFVAMPEDVTFAGRGWGLAERVMTEARILFQYLRLLLVPVRTGFGPYHDDYPASTALLDPPATVAALAGWLGLIALVVLARGPLGRLLSFSIGWFLIGHLLESTVFSLELYFEHRNYLPAVGVAIGVCALAWHPRLPLRSAAMAALAGLVALNLVVARETALVWGNPVLAGRFWFEQHPASHRTVLYYSRIVAERGDIPRAVAIVEAADPKLQQTLQFAAARLAVYCLGRGPAEVEDAMRRLELALAAPGPIDYTVPQDLGLVLELHTRGNCDGADPARVAAALGALAEVPPRMIHPRALVGVHEHLARYWLARRDLDRTMFHFEQEYRHSGAIEDIEKMVAVLLSAQLPDAARAKIELLRDRMPLNPVRRRLWQRRIEAMQQSIAGQ